MAPHHSRSAALRAARATMLAALAGLSLLGACATRPAGDQPAVGNTAAHAPDGRALFLQAWTIVRDRFYDPKMNGVDWDSVRDELLPLAERATNASETSSVINSALDRLHASHTRHYTPLQREYYELLDIFHPDGVPAGFSPVLAPGPVSYVGIGLVATTIERRVFVADVYEAGPAHRAGVRVGDEIIDVEGTPWSDIKPFRAREGMPTSMRIRRSPGAAPQEILVTPARIRPKEAFLAAMEHGSRIIERQGRRVAYVPIRSYANPDYQEMLVSLLHGPLHDAEALILDLRGGWGGANPEYLQLFNPLVPTYESRPRGEAWSAQLFTWRRPVVMLVDNGTRSGKEILAYSFTRHAVGPVVGEKTAGAVLGGSPFILADGSLLFLAVQDVRIDGVRLEGVGVTPTVSATRTLPYADGRDEQLDAALNAAITQLPR